MTEGNAIKWTWLGPIIVSAVIIYIGNMFIKQADEHERDHTALAVTTEQVEELKSDVQDVKGQVQKVQDTVNENTRKGDARWDWLERNLPPPTEHRTPRFGAP